MYRDHSMAVTIRKGKKIVFDAYCRSSLLFDQHLLLQLRHRNYIKPFSYVWVCLIRFYMYAYAIVSKQNKSKIWEIYLTR